jgi:hypothetical protein
MESDQITQTTPVNTNLFSWTRWASSKKMMERQDDNGFLEVLPAGDIVGSHGKTYLLATFDELPGYRT